MQFSKNKNASEQKRCIMDSKSLMKGKKCHISSFSADGKGCGTTRIFPLIKLIMRESCKSSISFRQQSRAGRCQSPDLPSIIELLQCSIVQMFSCSLFDVLTSQDKNENFHSDRAPDRNCDHRHSGGNASSGAGQGAG